MFLDEIKLKFGHRKFFWKIYVLLSEIYFLIKFGDRRFFRNVAIEISTKCNRKCDYCPNSIFDTPNLFMEKKVFEKIIERLKDIKFCGSLYFHFYNEPLLDKRLLDLVKYANGKLPKAMIRIYTNGDLLSEDNCFELIKAGVMEFVVTEHVPSTKIYRFKIKDLKKKYGSRIQIQHLKKDELINRGGLVEVANKEVKAKCDETLKTLQVDYEGNVILCCNDYFRKYKFGNLMKTDLVTIWKNQKYKNIRDNLNIGIIDLEICRKCLNFET